MKEIGGYFGLEESTRNEYYPKLVALNTGRNALLYVLKAKKVKKIYIPFYLCDTVSEICKKYNYDFEYYHIDKSFKPIFSKKLKKSEYIYIVNWFGQISNSNLLKYKEKYKNVIFDNVQAFFQKPVKGIDTIYSCRKFFGVPDGAYLYSNKNISKTLEQDFSYNRMNFLLGRFEKSAKEFYSEYSANNKFFMNEPIKQMSKITKNIMKGIDYDYVINKRNQNFSYLSERLSSINKLNIKFSVGPFAYPLYLENGSEIRKKLQEKNVYIPTLWPNVFDLCKENMLEYQYAKNILPIPCDQRYGMEEMGFKSREWLHIVLE